MLEALVATLATLVVIAIATGIGLAALRTRTRNGAVSGAWPFSLRRPLTEPEQDLYFRLRNALPDHIVLAQVGLARFIAVRRGHEARAWHDRIHRMSVDFLVCSRDATVLAAIELDDASHGQPDRVIAATMKEKALATAGVRLIRWSANAIPEATAIQAAIATEHATSTRTSVTTELTQPQGFRPA